MYRYEVNFWDEDNREPVLEKGLVAGSDYGEATNRLAGYYGKDNIIDIKIYELEDIIIDEDIGGLCDK